MQSQATEWHRVDGIPWVPWLIIWSFCTLLEAYNKSNLYTFEIKQIQIMAQKQYHLNEAWKHSLDKQNKLNW